MTVRWANGVGEKPGATVIAVLTALLIAGGAHDCPAADADWPFPHRMRSDLVFLSPLANYTIHPDWQSQWERHLVKSTGLQATSGSVGTDDLYTDLTLNLTEPLGHGVRFLYRLNWQEGLHLDLERQQHWLGFEIGLGGNIGWHLQVHPAADKEKFDVLAGFVLTDPTREQYLRLSLRWDDFMYERKNDQGGLSDEETIGVNWELRQESGRWELFSAGRYGSWSRRSFPDAALSPAVAGTAVRDGAGTVKLRYLFTQDFMIGASADHYRFEAAEQRRDSILGFDYANEFVHVSAVGLIPLSGPLRVRPQFHWVRQWAESAGRRAFTHRRDDIFPALFIEGHSPSSSTWEIGYLAGHHVWDFAFRNQPGDRTNGYDDKIAVGWTYTFRPTAKVQFGLSYELSRSAFGGGSVRWQMVF